MVAHAWHIPSKPPQPCHQAFSAPQHSCVLPQQSQTIRFTSPRRITCRSGVPTTTTAMQCKIVALVALLLPLAALAQDTTGQKVNHAPGYTFGSNVEGYLRLSTDVCDIKTAIGSGPNPPYAEARKIYVDGKNSRKSDGSIRTLREIATKSYAGEPVFDQFAKHFKTANFMDQPISFAFAGDAPYTSVGQRNETIVKGVEVLTSTVYLLHELDEGANLIRQKKLAASNGAPHNIDETWAIYTGITPQCSLWGSANRRGAEFGTMQDCETSLVNAGMTAAHRKLYQAAKEGNLTAYLQQQEEVERLFIITFIQAVLKYAELMDRAYRNNDMDTALTEQAEGAMFFRTIEPFIAEVNNKTVATVKRVMDVGNPVPPGTALSTVRPALEATYADLGIEPAEIGTFGAKQNLNCPTAKSAAGSNVVTAGGSFLLVLLVLLGAML